MHTVVKDMLRPTLIDLNDWLKRKAEAHERMNVSGTSKPKAEESKVKSNSKSFSATAAATGSTFKVDPVAAAVAEKDLLLLLTSCPLLPGMRDRPTRKVSFCPARVAKASTHCGSVMNLRRKHLRSARNLPLITISAFDA